MKPRVPNVWRCIISARHWIRKGACFQVGDGSNINVWCDPWLVDMIERIPIAVEGEDIRGTIMVADLRNEAGNGWNAKLAKRIFTTETANCILKVKWLGFACADKLMWKGLNARGFSVGSCFELNTQGSMEDTKVWKRLWKGKLHACLKMLLWRVHRGVLSTKEIISRKTGAGEKNCVMCGAEEETLFHLFKECPRAQSLAFESK